jgi:hypothetical protein
MNLYQYCGNNPGNWVDPWGLLITQQRTPYGIATVQIDDTTGKITGFQVPLTGWKPVRYKGFYIPANTSVGIEVFPDGSFEIGTSNPIELNFPGPWNLRVSRIKFGKCGKVMSSDVDVTFFPDFDFINQWGTDFIRNKFAPYQNFLSQVQNIFNLVSKFLNINLNAQ